MTVAFYLTTLVIVASPGTGVLVTLAAGLSRGTRAAIVAAFGCTLVIVPHMLAAFTGLAALLHTSALLFQSFKAVGVAYLVYMAIMTWRERGVLQVDSRATPRSDRDVIVSAVLVNLLNPKLSIFFFAFLPQFIHYDQADVLGQMLAMSLTFMAMTFVVFTLYGVFAGLARRRILSSPRVLTWLRRTFAAAFVGLGAKLAFADR